MTTLAGLQGFSFDSTAYSLIDVCYALAQGAIGIKQEDLVKDLDDIRNQRHADDVKVLLLASRLVRLFGDDLVGRALTMVAPAPLRPPPAGD
jgi:hypothetical protein